MNADHLLEVIEFSGPLPHPGLLAEYDKIVPGAAQMIVTAFTSQTEHRHHLERTIVLGNSRRSNWGLALGFVVVLTVLGLGTVLVVNGHETPGMIALAVPLPTLAGVFVYGKRSQRLEREAKVR